MQIDFTTMSERVTGLVFHEKQPWILAGLHSGTIQLWDYRRGTLIDSFDEHKGPVRSVHFHPSKPMFVSGGDDYKIKLWNYQTHQRLFTLVEHVGCIRTVQFHHELPWIVSASDDKTIRLWNWVSRTCIFVFTEHTDSVTCASFHRHSNLILSASLDNSVRVWDFGAFRESMQLGVKVKYVLEGKGNWASFHPNKLLVVYCADDSSVTLWDLNGHISGDKQTFPEHVKVSSAIFYGKRNNLVVFTDDDKSITLFDYSDDDQPFIIREEGRFTCLSSHPKMNLFAAAHDNGFILLKPKRERPAFFVSNTFLVYVRDKCFRRYDFSAGQDVYVAHMRPGTNTPRCLSYLAIADTYLLSSDSTNGACFELLNVGGKRLWSNANAPVTAVFVAIDSFASLVKGTKYVSVRKFNGIDQDHEITITLPIVTDDIFYAGTGMLLCRSEDKVVLFHLSQSQVLGEIQTPSVVRYAVWSDDLARVALLSKHTIIIASNILVIQCILRETERVKSGAWDNKHGVFIYTTLNHIKYCLPNGDSGIIKSLDVPLYVAKVSENIVHCLDRDVQRREITIDTTVYVFKLSILTKNFELAMSMIDSPQLCGQAMAAYLQQKGFPELALHFAKDEAIRFDLSTACGKFDESASKINKEALWNRLAMEALRQGEATTAEYAYMKSKNFERLSFLYLITGNREKLSELMKTAEAENNVEGQFLNALYLGDVQERVNILENAGCLPMAYVTAATHGLHDIAERLASELPMLPTLPDKTRSLLVPPPPIVMSLKDWPVVIKNGDVEDLPPNNNGAQPLNGDVEDAKRGLRRRTVPVPHPL